MLKTEDLKLLDSAPYLYTTFIPTLSSVPLFLPRALPPSLPVMSPRAPLPTSLLSSAPRFTPARYYITGWWLESIYDVSMSHHCSGETVVVSGLPHTVIKFGIELVECLIAAMCHIVGSSVGDYGIMYPQYTLYALHLPILYPAIPLKPLCQYKVSPLTNLQEIESKSALRE